MINPGRLLKSEYARNVLTLATGATVAQAIPVAITPFLTRIYAPGDFGLYGIYVALVSIGVMVATGRLEMAVIIARKQSDAVQLALLSFVFSGLFSILIACVVFVYKEPIAGLTGHAESGDWLYVVPVGIFLFSVYKILLHWLNRNKQYRLMSANRMTQSASISILQVIVGVTGKGLPGLILADCLGRAVSLAIICKRIRHTFQAPEFKLLKNIALIRRYRKFPFLGSPASLLNVLSLQLPYLIIPIIFNSAIAGLYFLVFRVLMMPIALVGESMMEVFRNKAVENLDKHGSCRTVFLKTLLCLVAIGLPPALLLILFGPEIFAFVFGEAWRKAGLYAGILAPMAFLRLVCGPLGGVLFVREKLRLVLLLQSLFFLMVGLSLALGWMYQDPVLLVTSLSVAGCLFYLAQGLSAFRLSVIENVRGK